MHDCRRRRANGRSLLASLDVAEGMRKKHFLIALLNWLARSFAANQRTVIIACGGRPGSSSRLVGWLTRRATAVWARRRRLTDCPISLCKKQGTTTLSLNKLLF
jgi:hypothetical protein